MTEGNKFEVGDVVTIPDVPVELKVGDEIWGRSRFHNPKEKGVVENISVFWDGNTIYQVENNDHYYWYREKDLVMSYSESKYQPNLF